MNNQILVLEGPQMVGKRIFADILAKHIRRKIIAIDLSKANDRRRIVHPDLFFNAHIRDLILIESIDRMPSILEDIRKFIQKSKKHPKLILTSNFKVDVIFQKVDLSRKFVVREVFPSSLNIDSGKKSATVWNHWLKGGFPGFFNSPSNRVLANRAERLIEKLMNANSKVVVGHQLNPDKIRQCLELAAYFQGSIVNMQIFGRSMGLSGPTVLRYLRFLEAGMIIRLLPALKNPGKKRFSRAPKIYIRDSGLLHYLLGIQNLRTLSKSASQAGSWEGYVVEEIAKLLSPRFNLFYYRTQHATEIQLVITKWVSSLKTERPVLGILIPIGSNPSVSRSQVGMLNDLSTRKNFMVVADPKSQHAEHVTLISLPMLLDKISSLRN